MKNQNGETEPSVDRRILPFEKTLNQYHAEQLNELYDQVSENVKAAFDAGIVFGEKLTEYKELCGHGHWESWLEANVKFSARTARRYMDVFEYREQLKSDNVSDLTLAYEMIKEEKAFFKKATKKGHSAISKVPETGDTEAEVIQNALKRHGQGRTTHENPGPNKAVKSEPESSSEPATTNVAPDPLLERWEKDLKDAESVLTTQEEEEYFKQIDEQNGRPYYRPFRLSLSHPDSSSSWLMGFASFLQSLNASPLSEQDRDYVLDYMNDPRTFLERYNSSTVLTLKR
jgi:hypothetical protein